MPRINIVDKGADPSGNVPIDDILDEYAAPNTELYFPEGTYLLDTFVTDHNRVQFRGDNATLKPTNRQSMGNWFELHSDDFVMDGFEWDIRECDYPPRFHLWGDNWEVKNIAVRGHCGTNGKNMDIHGVSYIRGWVTDPNGTGLFQNIYLADGSGPPGARTNRRAFLIEGAEQRGHIIFDRVWLEQWGENTLYANNHPGEMTMRNCVIRNSNVGVRVGGNTTIEGCTFIRNYDVPLQRQGWSGGSIMRGIRVEGDDEWAYPGELFVKDCDFVFHKPGGWDEDSDPWDSRPPITWKAPCESIRIEDCRIRYDGYNGYAINRGEGLGYDDQNQKFLEVKNVQIDHRGWRDYGGIGIQLEPEEIGELSGTIKTPGNLCSSPTVRSSSMDLTRGTPDPASETTAMDDIPPLGTTPSYSGDIPSDARLLVVDATKSGRTDYQFSVTGKIWKVAEWGASVDVEDKLLGGLVEGWANNYLDAYRFTGEIQSAEFTNPPTLFLDGEEVTVDDLRYDGVEEKDPDDVTDDEAQTFLKTLYAFLYNYFRRLFA